MNGPEFRRCGTILTAAADAGRKVAFITAKEKLRTVLGDGVVERGGIVFSSEKVDEAKKETHGIDNAMEIIGKPRPEIYSGDASIYVLEAGAALAEQGVADFLYLSTTDYMQHKFAPEAPEILDFHAKIDAAIGRLLDAGCTVALTADHGMNAKNDSNGNPKVIFVESLLREKFGNNLRVICPITDPYVVHHGALGSLVMVHLEDPSLRDEWQNISSRFPASPRFTRGSKRWISWNSRPTASAIWWSFPAVMSSSENLPNTTISAF